jgi:hypothetical protein
MVETGESPGGVIGSSESGLRELSRGRHPSTVRWRTSAGGTHQHAANHWRKPVWQAAHLSDVLAVILDDRFCHVRPGAKQYLAIKLEQRVKRIEELWQRAHETLHPESSK